MQAGPGQVVLYDPNSGGYFLNLGLGSQLDSEYGSEDDDDTPQWKLTQFVVKTTPKSSFGKVACLICFFIIITAIGIAIAISTLNIKGSTNDSGDVVPPPSTNLTFFLDGILAEGVNFNRYA